MDQRFLTTSNLGTGGASPTDPERAGARETTPERSGAEEPTGGFTLGSAGLSGPGFAGVGMRTETMGVAAVATPPSSHTDVLKVPNGHGNGSSSTRALSRAPLPVSSPTSTTSTLLQPAPLPVPDALALLKALRHRWLMAVSAGSIFAVAASIITWFLLPTTINMVTASALLYMKQADNRRVLWAWGERTDWSTFKRTQCDFIRTRTVLEDALKDEHAAALGIAKMSNAVEWLESKLKVDPRENSELVEVSMTGEKPAQVTILVNAIVEAYLRKYVDAERTRQSEILDEYLMFQRKINDEIRAKLQAVHAQRKLFPGAAPIDINQMMELEQFKRAQADLTDVTTRLFRASLHLSLEQQRKKTTKKPGAPAAIEIPRHLIDEELEKDSLTQDLRKRRDMLQSRIEGYKSFAAENTQSKLIATQLRGYQAELDSVEGELKKREEKLKPRILDKFRATIPAAVSDSTEEKLKEQIQQLSEEQTFAKEQYEKSQRDVEKFYGKSSADLEQLVADIDSKKDIAKSFAMDIEAMKLELKNPPRVKLIQPATEPQPRDPHRQTKTVFLAGISAFLFVGFCTAWLEFRSQRLHSADEIIHGLGLRLLGTVPALPNRIRQHPLELETLQDSRLHNLVAESFDGIRTMILHEARQSPLRVLMVASGVSGEGKTTLSSHLAYSLAHAGYKTLLIDCDLVHPTLHQLFELPLTPGVCEVLRGQVDYATAIVPTTAPGLSLLPAGDYDRQVSQVLAKGWIQNLFDTLRSEYEFIIIDTCPVLSVANTLLIGQHVDGVVLSLLRDRSQAPKVHATYHRLASLGIRVLGAVFSKARNDVYGYYGYYHDNHKHDKDGKTEATAPA